MMAATIASNMYKTVEGAGITDDQITKRAAKLATDLYCEVFKIPR